VSKELKVKKTFKSKKRHYPTEAQAKYILDMQEARRLRKIFAED
jgi:hypothetical protein